MCLQIVSEYFLLFEYIHIFFPVNLISLSNILVKIFFYNILEKFHRIKFLVLGIGYYLNLEFIKIFFNYYFYSFKVVKAVKSRDLQFNSHYSENQTKKGYFDSWIF